MTKKLMTDVWFRGVHGLGTMSNILGGVEDLKCQTSKEITGLYKPYGDIK